MNCTKLLLSLLMSITTISASNINHTNFDDIPFTTTARGAPNQTFETQENQNEAEPASPITKRKVSNFPPQKINRESGFNNTFSPGANPQTTGDPFVGIVNNERMINSVSDNSSEQQISTKSQEITTHPLQTESSKQSSQHQLDIVFSTASQENTLTRQNANNGIMRTNSSDGSTIKLADTNNFPGHRLGKLVKNNKSQNDDLDDNNDQASAAPTNSQKANNEPNEK